MRMPRHFFLLIGLFVVAAFGGKKPGETRSTTAFPVDAPHFDRLSIRIELKHTKQGYTLEQTGDLIFSSGVMEQAEKASSDDLHCTLPINIDYTGDKKALDQSSGRKLSEINRTMKLKPASGQMDYRTGFFKFENSKRVRTFGGKLQDLLVRYELTPLEDQARLSPAVGSAPLSANGLGFVLPLDDGFNANIGLTLSLSPRDDAGTSPLCQRVIQLGWVVEPD